MHTMSSEVLTAPATETPVRHYHPLQKDYATFLKTSAETGGEYTLLEIEVAPGGGNSPHYHLSYAEHFKVLEGTLMVGVGDRTYSLRPGDGAVAPINTLHYFRNITKTPVTFQVELRPGSVGFENAIKAGYGLARDGKVFLDGTPRNPYHLAVLLEWSEIALPGLLGRMMPLFRWLTKRAKKKGIDRELFDRYCR